MQAGEKRQRLGVKDFRLPAAGLAVNFDAC
jgi:hypothetical protein